jgi:hypothetical protein
MSVATEIGHWLIQEWSHADQRRKAELSKLAEQVKAVQGHPHAEAFPVGSYQRQLAKRRERKLILAAKHAGFQPSDEQIKELGLHLAEHALGLSL